MSPARNLTTPGLYFLRAHESAFVDGVPVSLPGEDRVIEVVDTSIFGRPCSLVDLVRPASCTSSPVDTTSCPPARAADEPDPDPPPRPAKRTPPSRNGTPIERALSDLTHEELDELEARVKASRGVK